jgi:hypothetical protein
MNDGTAPSAQGSWGCDCADCRRYRVWQSEGVDDWQPERDGWSAWTTWSDGGSPAPRRTSRTITTAAGDFAGRS